MGGRGGGFEAGVLVGSWWGPLLADFEGLGGVKVVKDYHWIKVIHV